MVAAGFNLVSTFGIICTGWCRVAMHEGLEDTPAFNRRSATAARLRLQTVGQNQVKPTATFISSLRDKVSWPGSGSWGAPFRFFACIGTMNVSGSCHRYGVPPSGGPDRLKPGLQTGGSWKASGRGGTLDRRKLNAL